ncbi:MAG TPA: hypothetical protein VHE99_02980 [Gammaproteobacteria bacterium]|nr:hypothetical protein [Gammaproteobacteria bacterium]HVY54095.1 hypothetical protein [Gammaproteobacteria bacterium]
MKKEATKTQRSEAVMFLLIILKILAAVITVVLGSLSNQRVSKPKTSYDRLMDLAKIDPNVINQNRSENH